MPPVVQRIRLLIGNCLKVKVVFKVYCLIIATRSYAALRAADLNWIVGPGYNAGGYILEKKPTWNHEKP